ncbi:MAG TPA: hypothetical protein VFS44_12590, partial [Gemmatimonadaceae bacterium]|nr:hypothetical protein [Gemmatimonadaceae bacterium]
MVDVSPPHRLSDAELARRRAESAELLEVARPHLDWLSATFARVPHVACVVDRDGFVLHAIAPAAADDATHAPLLPGHHWSERAMGASVAASAPVRAPEGEMLGAVALVLATTEPGASEPRQAVAYAAWAVERELSARD